VVWNLGQPDIKSLQEVTNLFPHIKGLVEQAVKVPGDFAEIGVYRGSTFPSLAQSAADAGKICHAIDSFCGFAEPTAHDFSAKGRCHYPKGHYDSGGTGPLLRALGGKWPKHVHIWQGFVPEVLGRITPRPRLAFVHVDLDQYLPTYQAMAWAWGLLPKGGIVCSHDWNRGRVSAAAGVRAFMRQTGAVPTGEDIPNKYIWFIKG